MDNRLNEIRREISALRANMLRLEDSIRDQINHDLDCTETSLRLMALRRGMVEVLRQWKTAGGGDRCPPLEERLQKDKRVPAHRTKPPHGAVRH
jgi:hypothetical protein